MNTTTQSNEKAALAVQIPVADLRDYFAAKAPLHDFKFDSPEAMADFAGLPLPTSNRELISLAMACAAKAAYIYADAMLKAREQ